MSDKDDIRKLNGDAEQLTGTKATNAVLIIIITTSTATAVP